MTKEQQIEEMAQFLQKHKIGCLEDSCEKCHKCKNYRRAVGLYETGYRKADDVRRESVEEFAERLEETMYRYYANNSITVDVLMEELDEIVEEYLK